MSAFSQDRIDGTDYGAATGEGGELEAARAARKPRTHWDTVRDLIPFLWPRDRPDLRRRLVFAIIVMILGRVTIVQVPFFYKGAVDGFDQETAAMVAVPLFFILGYGIARFVSLLFGHLREAILARVLEATQRAIAVRTFGHLHNLSLRFHLERRTGGLARIIERGTRASSLLLRVTFFHIAPALIELTLVSIILTYMFGWLYALVTTVTVLGYIWYTFAVTEWRVALRRQMNDKDSESNTKAIDSLLNFETVKYFGNETHEWSRFDRARSGYEDAAVKTTTSLALLNTGQAFIFAIGLTLLMVMAGYGVAKGDLSVGDFVLINTFLLQLQAPLSVLGWVYRELKQSFVDMERIFDVLGVAPEVTDKPAAKALSVNGGTVTFDHVNFSYDRRRPILKDVSFSVPAGKTVAIVGPSGAGKSTISRILFRFYDVTSGSVKIDGQDISDVTQASLRAHIGMVPQDTVLFNDSIRYNIRYGRPDASDEDVEKAARLARIHDFVAGLPDGYDTIVGERGLKLSGGEKQRVAIARTLLKDPPILILDEATSALDSHTEGEIQQALRLVSENRTTVIIAHRLSTIVDADEILVLKAGRVVERGHHAELLTKGGAYAQMWSRQQELWDAEHRLALAREAAGDSNSTE